MILVSNLYWPNIELIGSISNTTQIFAINWFYIENISNKEPISSKYWHYNGNVSNEVSILHNIGYTLVKFSKESEYCTNIGKKNSSRKVTFQESHWNNENISGLVRLELQLSFQSLFIIIVSSWKCVYKILPILPYWLQILLNMGKI